LALGNGEALRLGGSNLLEMAMTRKTPKEIREMSPEEWDDHVLRGYDDLIKRYDDLIFTSTVAVWSLLGAPAVLIAVLYGYSLWQWLSTPG
jgi:hypothetical protein